MICDENKADNFNFKAKKLLYLAAAFLFNFDKKLSHRLGQTPTPVCEMAIAEYLSP